MCACVRVRVYNYNFGINGMKWLRRCIFYEREAEIS
jgi:hypothetical protein